MLHELLTKSHRLRRRLNGATAHIPGRPSALRWNPAGWLPPTVLGAVLLAMSLDAGLLQYDETDYVMAARRGFVANYIDADAMPVREFIEKGIRAVVFGDHRSLSRQIRERHDITFYRHYHAPLMFYLLAVAGNLFGTSEIVFRIVAGLTAVAIIPATYWCAHLVLGHLGRWVGFLSALLVVASPMVHKSSGEISVHPLYAALALMIVATLVRYFQTKRLRDFYLFAALMALAFLTNELAVFLLAACGFSFLLVPNHILSFLRNNMRVSYHLLGGIAVSVLVLFVLWPASLLKLSAVKGYIFFAYAAFVKREIAFGSPSIVDNWLRRFTADPVESVLILVGAGFALHGFIARRLDKALLPLFIYPVVIFLGNLLNKGTSDAYVVSMYPFLLIFATLGIVEASERQGRTAISHTVAMVAIGLAVIGNMTLHRFPPAEDVSAFPKAFDVLRADAKQGDRMLVSYGLLATMNYYLPEFDIHTIYREDTPEEIAAKLDQRLYRYFIFFGTEDELRTASYRWSLATHYREVQRVPTSRKKVLIIFRSL